jgi:hypothetical protein
MAVSKIIKYKWNGMTIVPYWDSGGSSGRSVPRASVSLAEFKGSCSGYFHNAPEISL